MGEIPRESEEIPEAKPRRKTKEEMMDEIMKKDREKFDAIEGKRKKSLDERKISSMKGHAERIDQAKEEHKLALEELKKAQEELKKKNEEVEKLRKSLGL